MDDQGTNRAGGGLRFRKLRIAWSVACGVLCLLLIALWVRSYWRYNALFVPQPKLEIQSIYGVLWACDPGPDFKISNWFLSDKDAAGLEKSQIFPSVKSLGTFHLYPTLAVPYWFLALIAATFGVIPWLPWSTSFSLRTLLIGMTAVAAILGLIVWATK
jgi:hypothetical protein